MKFTKMHGCGNDYIYVNCFEETVTDPVRTAIAVSDRHFGIGADGLICICPSDKADFRMEMYNADGSEGRMCGNGIRCVAKYVYDHGMTDQTMITVETLSGIKTLQLFTQNQKVQSVTVDMGAPIWEPAQIPVCIPDFDKDVILQEPITVTKDGMSEERAFGAVSMGNPHAVIRVEEDVHTLNLSLIGPLYENHPWFPDRINTEFIRVISRDSIDMRVWERGSGETLACGTGACASVAVCVRNGWTDDRVLVHLLGGDLEVFYDRQADTMRLTGPAVVVCTGEMMLS